MFYILKGNRFSGQFDVAVHNAEIRLYFYISATPSPESLKWVNVNFVKGSIECVVCITMFLAETSGMI